MTKHLIHEVENLKERFIALSSLVEERVSLAIEATVESDIRKAEQVIDGDSEIDTLEIALEEECLKLLALHQPVAIDLRFLIAVLKMTNDLERIGDHAVNIADRSKRLAGLSGSGVPSEIGSIAEKVKALLHASHRALIGLDTKQARAVVAGDQEVDALNREVYRTVIAAIKRDSSQTERMLHVLSISKQLERIGDLATNLAEDVIYMLEGTIVRHRRT